MKHEDLMRLNLQFFANQDEGEGEEQSEENSEITDDQTTKEEESQGENNTGGEPGKKDGDAETIEFTPEQQKRINEIVKERLARERKKQEEREKQLQEEAERKRLEEQGEYKDLAEKLQQKLDDYKSQALDAKKEALLSKAGYKEDQIERYKKYVDGETEEEIQASIDELKQDIPPVKPYVDPGAGNGQKQAPKKKDLHEKGKSIYQRLKEKGKIRGRN